MTMKHSIAFAAPLGLIALLLGLLSAPLAAAEPSDVTAPPAGSLDDQLLGDLKAELRDELAEESPAAPPRDEATTATEAKKEAAPSEAKPTAEGGSALDDELLRGLGGDLLEGLDEPRASQAGGAQTEKRMTGQNPDETLNGLDEELLRGLGGDLGEDAGDEADPLVSLSRQMRQVESRIRDSQSDEATQEMQQEIIRELARLIEQVKKQQQQQQQSSSSSQQQTAERQQIQQPQNGQSGQQQQQAGQQNQAARDSSQQLSQQQTERPDPAQLEALVKNVWGELPERLRQQMMQSSMEEFLPKYELLIEQYYRTLSERQQER